MRKFSTISIVQTLYLRHYSTTTANNLPDLLKAIPLQYRPQVIRKAREELTEYLHDTGTLPFSYAEKISTNSTHSISKIILKVPFTTSNYSKTFQKFLRYNPINEFDFFYESIGIDYLNINKFLKPNVLSFQDDCIVLDAACYLAGFGFPWDKLGRLYVADDLIFRKKPEFLRGRLDRMVELGFTNQQTVHICLAFPGLLKEEKDGLDCDFDASLDNLKMVSLDFGFPLDKLERVCVEEDLTFGKKIEFLRGRLNRLVSLGFDNQLAVGICLAFPVLLKEEKGWLDCDFDALLDDLKRVFLDFEFPLDKLERFCVEEDLIFRKKLKFVRGRLDKLVSFGFGNQQAVSIGLAFPGLLKEEEGVDCDFDAVLDVLKRVLDLDLGSCTVENLDVWFEACKKVMFFYELGVEKGELEKLMVEAKSILTCFPMEVLVEKVEFFSRLGVEKSDVGVLILSNPKILSIKFKDRVISVSSFLEHLGLCKEKLLSVEQEYGYVFGRNKMVNLPSILRAMDLHGWFFNRMKCGYYDLFASYDLSSPDDGLDENYEQNLESLKTRKSYHYTNSKLNFFHCIGFGENSFTVKLLASAKGSPSDLQERFDFLLSAGFEYSRLCSTMKREHKLLNQDIGILKKKINFLVQEIGLPVGYLETYPAYLMFNLEERIAPRYKFHEWLTNQGLCTKKYTLSTIISTGNNGFMSHLSHIDPSAPQLWMEQYGNKLNNEVDE